MSKELKDSVTPTEPEKAEATSHGEHSDHHDHHSDHHHHHKKRTLKEKLKSSFTKHTMGLVITVSAVVVVFMAIVVIVDHMQSISFGNNAVGSTGDPTPPTLGEDTHVYIGAPLIDGEICLLGDAAKEYIASDISVNVKDIYARYEDTDERLDVGTPVELKFDVSGLPSQINIDDARLELSESSNFSSTVFYELDNKYTVSIYNLKTGTTYSYRAVFTLSNGTVLTHGGDFTTVASPRMMTIDGIFNVRDVGGWKTVDGRSVHQGLLFRGTELDSAVEDKYLITQEGINELLLNLGVKTDMDLRASSDRMPGRYVLGTNVNHKYYNAMMYEGVFTVGGKEGIRDIFRDLAQPKNYPIYMHCTYGCDRTGTICYLLGALLGVSENDLIRDYELSAFFSLQID